ncbi:MAG: pyrD [Bacteroidota bacterium]|nr:pyrD [Bacteroidota bacterium]
MYKLIRWFLFLMDAEKAHHLTLRVMNVAVRFPFFKKLLQKLFVVDDIRLHRNVFGLTFPNPVGLAAGMDKNAESIDAFAAVGFGFIEIGTVTPAGQAGNDKPRLFRLIKDQAIINRMGFNNVGMAGVKGNILKSSRFTVHSSRTNTVNSELSSVNNIIIGGNIGKNKITSNENAVDDYLQCFDTLFDVVDYFVVNVSSPNTADLRQLQEREPLTKILTALQASNQLRAKPKPILLKIAPDLTETQLDDIISIVFETKLSGIVATNTTILRDDLETDKNKIEMIGNGGLSGKPLSARSTEVIRYIHLKSGGKIPVIASGGIMTAEDAIEKLNAGATLVQLYTGFVYEGPALIKEINERLLKDS